MAFPFPFSALASRLRFWFESPRASAAPAPATDPAFWFKASENVYTDAAGTVPVSADGQSVDSWRGKEAAANLLVGTTNKPTYETNMVNGEPALQFNGTAPGGLAKTGLTDVFGSGVEFSFAMCVAIGGGGGSNGPWMSQDMGGGPQAKVFIDNGLASRGGTPGMGVHLGPGGVNMQSNSGAPHGPTFIIALFSRAADGAWTYRIDGAEVASGTETTALASPNTGPLAVGEAEGFVLNGFVAEVIGWSRGLTADEIADTEEYLNDEYACY